MSVSALIILAGLMGAVGVALTAASAHAAPGAGLDSAGYMLLFHAAAIVGAAVAAQQGIILRRMGVLSAAGLVVGAGLFAGDIALRALVGHRLFPMAAPTGGIILIVSWLALSASAAVAILRA
jgi:uncharacterized membrane protein YgdD (TMEM256/DUF423 family)